MGTRGRRSAADISIPDRFRANAIVRRPDPPRDLSAAEATEWREIVASLPADYFANYSRVMLLELLCAQTASARFIDRLLEDCRNKNKLDREYEQLLNAQLQGSEMIIRLSRALGFHRLLSTQPSQRPVLPAPWHRQ